MKKDCSLVIMAAGIGSRYKGGIKQLETVGPNKELIIDYSIKDALEAGFTKIVFVIRREIEDAFKEVIGDRIVKLTNVDYVYQETSYLPSGFEEYEKTREKPWGTGQAVFLCESVVHEPFCIINADDYYGKSSFQQMYDYIQKEMTDEVTQCVMMGYRLENTLSESGAVTRGICNVDSKGYLLELVETRNVKRINGVIESMNAGVTKEYKQDTPVSMNMWGFPAGFLGVLEIKFKTFLANLTKEEVPTKEFLIPEVIDKLLKAGEISVRVLRTDEKWYGITYKEDLESVREHLKNGQ